MISMRRSSPASSSQSTSDADGSTAGCRRPRSTARLSCQRGSAMIWSDLWGWSLTKEDEGQIPVRVGWVTMKLTVEEFHPYEPSAYVWDPGWTCFDGAGQEFFVSQSGT